MTQTTPGAEQALIYATGSDRKLRDMCWALLEETLIHAADLVERVPLYLADTKRRQGATGRGVVMTCDRAQLEAVMARMRVAYAGDDLLAWAMPVSLTL